MYFIYSTDVSLFFSIIREHWHIPPNSTRVTKFRRGTNRAHNTGSCIPVLYGQYCVQFRWTTSMNWTNLELWLVVFQNRFLQSWCVHIHSSWAWANRCERHNVTADDHATTFEFAATFSDKLHSQYVTTIYPNKVEVNFDGENMFRPWKPTDTMNFFANKVSKVTATAKHTISWTESKSLAFASSVLCHPWY